MNSAFTALLETLAEHLSLPADELIAQQEILIDDIAISFQSDTLADSSASNAFILSCYFGTPNEARWREVAYMLLQANHFWTGTGGGTLAMLPESNDVTWCMRVPLSGLKTSDVVELLANVVSLARAWRTYIEQTSSDNEGALSLELKNALFV